MERARLTRTAAVRPPVLQRACKCGQRTRGNPAPCSCHGRAARDESEGPAGLLERAGVRDVLRTPGRGLDGGSLSLLGPSVLAAFSNLPAGVGAERLGGDLAIGPTDDAMEHAAERTAATVRTHGAGGSAPKAAASFDLSHVRIHADARAARSADILGAKAYTVGRHVVFGADQYRPDTTDGAGLLAHELTHVAQQLGGAEPATLRGQFYEVERRGLGEFAGGKNVPRRSLPRRRGQGPMMRRQGAETVKGFPLKQAHCGCESLIASELQGIEERIQAYESCARRPGMTILGLKACVRHQIYGQQDVPAGGFADPISGTVEWPTPERLERRAAALGQPAYGPCADLRNWGTLVHETGHLRDFEAIAESIDPTFAKELDKLAGDPKRLERLSAESAEPAGSRSFKKEASEYRRRTLQPTVEALKTTEVQSYERERRFYHDVRGALARMCAPPPPEIRLIKSRRRPYRPRTTPQVDYSLEGP